MGTYGTCSKCGRDMKIGGTWGNPPVAQMHCTGCNTYPEFCRCRPLSEKYTPRNPEKKRR